MENIQDKINLEKPTQEQIKPIFILWNHILESTEDFDMRIKMTRAYLREFNCEGIWGFKFATKKPKEQMGSKSIDDKELGTLVLEKLFTFIYNPKFVNSTVQTNEMFELLKEKEFKINALSQESRECLETNIINILSNFQNAVNEEKAKREKQLINFIETVGLFKDLTEKRTLDFTKNVVTSNSTNLLKWLFSRGLSPNTMIEQNNDKWPLASLSPTIDMLNVFVSHGANLALTSKNGVAFSKLLSKRTKSFYPFTTLKDRDQIVSTVYKAEIAIQTNPQEYLWSFIKEAKNVRDAAIAISSHKNVCNLRDPEGNHIMQFTILNKPSIVDIILSIDKNISVLCSTPDERGRLPSVYWIVSSKAQEYIRENDKTTFVIPKQINEETWRQAAELAYERVLEFNGFFSVNVQQKFKETTGKKLDEWIEEEAANGIPWFERMLDLAIKIAKKRAYTNDSHKIHFPFSDANNKWSDINNRHVVNEAHALFRAHLMLARFVNVCDNDNLDNLHGHNKNNAQKMENFLKINLSDKAFDNFKHQINNGISFMNYFSYGKLAKSKWWKETCATIEKENLLKKHVKIVNTTAHNKFDAL